MIRFILTVIIFTIASNIAHADDFEMSIKAFPEHILKEFRNIKDRTKVSLDSCIDGSDKKRTVCTYRFDSYMMAIAAGAIGSDQLSDLTLICSAKTDAAGAQCLVAYAVAMAATVPTLRVEQRGEIIKVLFSGMKIGEATKITKDGRNYILQRVGGTLWFHIAVDE